MGATGFIYVVRSVTKDYVQKNFYNVPTEWGERLYFGPCKKPMRPKMKPGDYIFGLSPSGTRPRRIVFAVQIEERISFGEAYRSFPDLRGPEGPIHVRPVQRMGHFPVSHYEHIPGAMHEEDWEADLKSLELDAFFVCSKRSGWLGRWLGHYGPEIDEDILDFFKKYARSMERKVFLVDRTLLRRLVTPSRMGVSTQVSIWKQTILKNLSGYVMSGWQSIHHCLNGYQRCKAG